MHEGKKPADGRQQGHLNTHTPLQHSGASEVERTKHHRNENLFFLPMVRGTLEGKMRVGKIREALKCIIWKLIPKKEH